MCPAPIRMRSPNAPKPVGPAAQEAGRFKDQLTPVTIPQRKGAPLVVATDEHPRPGTAIEALAKLRGINGTDKTVTAGNASGVNDGAAALLIASEQSVRSLELEPMARVVTMASAGWNPG